MTILPVLLLATTMAIFGTLGYLKGSKWAFISLLILLAAFVAIKVAEDQIVAVLNGLYVGVMVTLKGGLGAIASGDVDALKETLSSIDKPFTGENEEYALLLFILGAVAVGLLLYLIMKKSKSTIFALILGLVYGYVLMAAVLPLVTNIPPSSIPVPIIQPSGQSEQIAQQAQSKADQLWETLATPQNIQILTALIIVFIALFLILTVRKGAKSPGAEQLRRRRDSSMGPIELLFLTVIGLFGAIGLVRGYQRELGVTTMLLLALFVIEFFTSTALGDRVITVLTNLGLSQTQLATIVDLTACGVLLLITFISYQGLGLIYPGSGQNHFVSLMVGLINGYFLAGSIWWYLQEAGWPFGEVTPTYTPLYEFLVQLLPPAIFPWQFYILVAVTMLIIRVVK